MANFQAHDLMQATLGSTIAPTLTPDITNSGLVPMVVEQTARGESS
jgi:hypothetical protein